MDYRTEPAGQNLIVESTRLSLDNLNDKFLDLKPKDKIRDSTEFLKSRDKGMLMSTWDDDYFEKLH